MGPRVADDAADGLPSRLVSSYRSGSTMPARIAAMSLAAVRPGPIRRELELESLDAIHFPLSVMLPPVSRPPAAHFQAVDLIQLVEPTGSFTVQRFTTPESAAGR